ncbi:hypothetical protein [Nannocystis pusilla]|uniref:hypothetical protein n=1 Tax=Nannocystis pusilla TaxID=889268 RepID=UPI003B7E7F4C
MLLYWEEGGPAEQALADVAGVDVEGLLAALAQGVLRLHLGRAAGGHGVPAVVVGPVDARQREREAGPGVGQIEEVQLGVDLLVADVALAGVVADDVEPHRDGRPRAFDGLRGAGGEAMQEVGLHRRDLEGARVNAATAVQGRLFRGRQVFHTGVVVHLADVAGVLVEVENDVLGLARGGIVRDIASERARAEDRAPESRGLHELLTARSRAHRRVNNFVQEEPAAMTRLRRVGHTGPLLCVNSIAPVTPGRMCEGYASCRLD